MFGAPVSGIFPYLECGEVWWGCRARTPSPSSWWAISSPSEQWQLPGTPVDISSQTFSEPWGQAAAEGSQGWGIFPSLGQGLLAAVLQFPWCLEFPRMSLSKSQKTPWQHGAFPSAPGDPAVTAPRPKSPWNLSAWERLSTSQVYFLSFSFLQVWGFTSSESLTNREQKETFSRLWRWHRGEEEELSKLRFNKSSSAKKNYGWTRNVLDLVGQHQFPLPKSTQQFFEELLLYWMQSGGLWTMALSSPN